MSRKFRFDDTSKWLYGFGDGSAGNGSINTSTDAPIDSTCSGTSGTKSLTATNASFSAGQLILIYQVRGTGAGEYELNRISSYVAGTITTTHPLQNTYTTSGASAAQVIVGTQYNDLTINTSQTLTLKAWDGSTGGVYFKFVKGTFTVSGAITGTGKGYRGGSGATSQGQAYCGEGSGGASAATRSANGNGGGGGQGDDVAGGGGGNANNAGATYTRGNYGLPGNSVGAASLTTAFFGGAGGGGAEYGSSPAGPTGANGGGMVFVIANAISITGSIAVAGNTGSQGDNVSSGSGAGGSILLKCKTATLGTNLLSAAGGGAVSGWGGNSGGAGSVGRLHLDYKTSYTGSTSTPSIDVSQDLTLDYAPTAGGAFLYNFM